MNRKREFKALKNGYNDYFFIFSYNFFFQQFNLYANLIL